MMINFSFLGELFVYMVVHGRRALKRHLSFRLDIFANPCIFLEMAQTSIINSKGIISGFELKTSHTDMSRSAIKPSFTRHILFLIMFSW